MSDNIEGVSKLTVIVPNSINLVSSTVPETEYPQWTAGTYGISDRRIKNHRIYESLRAGNTTDPALAINRTGSTPWWNDLGPTNQYAMFDQKLSTVTKANGTMTVVMNPGSTSDVTSGNITGVDSVVVQVHDNSTNELVYTREFNLDASQPADYDEYFFGAYESLTTFLANDIPLYYNPKITVTYTGDAEISVGMLTCGTAEILGETQYGLTISPRTFSYIGSDKYGDFDIIRRPFATDLKATAKMDLSRVNQVIRTCKKVLDIPCVIIASDLPDHEEAQTYGLINASISYDFYRRCSVNISVTGMS